MDYLAVRIDTNHRGLEPLTAFLASQDIESLMIEDDYEARTLETPDAPPPTGDESARVTFYLTADDTGFAQLGAARIALSGFRREHADCGTLLMTLGTRRRTTTGWTPGRPSGSRRPSGSGSWWSPPGRTRRPRAG